MALWGGRFETGPDAIFREINDSLRFDARLALHDIDGSIAWANALARANVLTDEEHLRLKNALLAMRATIAADPELPLRDGRGNDEDIHSFVERRLTESLGPLAKKLHTGRSRNDQVATDLRLWTRDAIDARLIELMTARASLLDLASRERSTVISGYTHLQRAQPLLLAHWALAYEAMLARDSARFRDARARVNLCPLGSGALAGTAYPIDRHALAQDLHFAAPTTNSLDAVSDRDFVLETLATISITATHISRLGEDLVLYGSQEFNFFEFGDQVSSGSSLMPQKKNPDAAELMRGKAARTIGSLVTLLTAVKGLPLAYNKDLQEDKEPLFDAMDTLSLMLRVTPVVIRTLKVRADVCRKAAEGGHSNATDLADYLVEKNIPFREAHDLVGKAVRRALELDLPLDRMPLDELRVISPAIAQDVFPRLSIEASLNRREVLGGTGPKAVHTALTKAQDQLNAERS